MALATQKKLLSAALMTTVAFSSVACNKNESGDNGERARLEKAATDGVAATNSAKALEAQSQKAISEAKLATEKANAAEAAVKAERAAFETEKATEVEKQRTAMAAIETERAAVIAEKQAVQAAKDAVDAEIAQKKADLATATTKAEEAQTALTTLEQKRDQLKAENEKSAGEIQAQMTLATNTLADAKNKLTEATTKMEEANTRLADVERREKEVTQREERVNIAINAWKDIYSKYKMTDIFERIMNGEEQFLFQVSLVGYADRDVLAKARELLTAVNTDAALKDAKILFPTKMPARIVKAEKGPKKTSDQIREEKEEAAAKADKRSNSAVVADAMSSRNDGIARSIYDSYLIKASAKNLKSVQDQINAIADADKSGNSLLFAIVRLVENTHVQVQLKVNAREKSALKEKQYTYLKLDLGSKPVADVDFAKVVIDKPGRYFLGDKNANICITVSAECLQAMKAAKMLDSEYTVEITDGNYKEVEKTATAQQLLRQMLYLSTQQTVKDLTLRNGEALAGVRRYMNSQGEIKRGFAFADNFWSKLFNIEDRFPVVNEITLTYQLVMQIETPRSGVIPLDSVVGNQRSIINGRTLMSVRDLRRTYTIPLPVQSLEVSSFYFPREGKEAVEQAKKEKLAASQEGLSTEAKQESDTVMAIGEILGMQQQMVRALK